MFRRLLIANRGEIAIRVARTAREMGVHCIGVYSEADRGALHRAAMDETVAIGGPLPADSYLHIAHVLQAAHDSHADAIHPGYGFLSENPTFATRCAEEGLVFVGPPPDAMALSGDKIAARMSMASLGLPAPPASTGRFRRAQDPGAAAPGTGYPGHSRATAGGGGTGTSRAER